MLFKSSRDKSTPPFNPDPAAMPADLGGDHPLVYHPPKVASSSLIQGLFQTIFGKDGTNKGQQGAGQSESGDFDVDSFIESTLGQARGGSADGIPLLIGGLLGKLKGK